MLIDKPDIVQDAEVLGEVNSCGHKLLRFRIKLNLERERMKVEKSRKPSRNRSYRVQEFRVSVQKKFPVLTGENEDIVDILSDSLTTVITVK